MLNYILPLITGFVVGLIFVLLKLPIPAPAVLEGVMGIIGIFVGYNILMWIGWI